MIKKLNEHYSFTNPASVHDEESLTALELAGRQGAKINELIDESNKMPEKVTAEIQKQIDNGTFDKAIDEYAGDIKKQVDNLTKNLEPGSTKMDAVIVDAFHNTRNGKTYNDLQSRLDAEYQEGKMNSACVHGVFFTSTPVVDYKAGEHVKLSAEGLTYIYYDGIKYDVDGLHVERTADVSGALFKVAFFPEYNEFAIYHNTEKIPTGGLLFGLIYEKALMIVNELTNTYNDVSINDKTKYAPVILNGEANIKEENENTVISIPAMTVLCHSKAIPVLAQDITIPTTIKQLPLRYLYYDLDDTFIKWGSAVANPNQLCIGYISNKGVYFNALNNTDMDARYRVTLLGSSKTKCIAIDTVKKTITFPPDMLAIYKQNVFGCIGNSATTPTVISYASVGSSAVNVWIDRNTHIPVCLPYYTTPTNNYSLLFTLRTNTGICDLSVPYTVDGKLISFIPLTETGELDIQGGSGAYVDDSFIMSIAHRGLSAYAPENTLPAFKKAKENGFKYVECDVRRSSDGEIVLIHDASVDRTSNGTGNVADMSLAQLQTLDFGLWFSEEYSGTQILTLKEFLIWCRNNGVKPIIEIKDSLITSGQVDTYFDEMSCFEKSDVIIASVFSSVLAEFAMNEYNVCYVHSGTTYDSQILSALGPIQSKLTTNKLHIALPYGFDFQNDAMSIKSNVSDIFVWTIDDENGIKNMHSSVGGFISNSLHAGKILKDG